MAGGATNHPASTALNNTRMTKLFSSMTQVLGNRAVNEARVGWHSLYYTNTNYTHWENHPARGAGHHHRLAAHHVPRVRDLRQREPAAAPGPRHLFRARRLQLRLQQGRQSRAQDGRRVPLLRPRAAQLPQLHGHHRRTRRAGACQYRGAVPGVGRSGHVEPGGAVADHPVVPDRHRQLQLQPEAEGRRGLGAGRLAGHRPPDAQPRPPLRRRARRVGQRHGHRAVAGAGPARRHEQHRSAPRLRLHAEPANGAPRRLRLLLRRGAEQHLVVHAVVRQHRQCRTAERRPARLRGQPVQRADADLRPGPAAPLRRTRRADLPAAERQHDCAAAGVRARAVQLSDLVRDSAPVRRGRWPSRPTTLTRAAGTSASARATTRS